MPCQGRVLNRTQFPWRFHPVMVGWAFTTLRESGQREARRAGTTEPDVPDVINRYANAAASTGSQGPPPLRLDTAQALGVTVGSTRTCNAPWQRGFRYEWTTG